MARAGADDVTELLLQWGGGNHSALDRLMPVVYGELRRVAGRYLRHERPNHTLQPTVLVHEAYLRLMDQRRAQWQKWARISAGGDIEVTRCRTFWIPSSLS